MKLLPRILRSDASRGRKIEAAFHLTSPIVYPCVILIALLMLPAVLVNLKPFEQGTFSAGIFGLMILLLATASGVTFYVAGQIERRAGFWRTLAQVPPLIALGVGMSMNNTIAVIEALLGRQSAFVRTPKFNRGEKRSHRAETQREAATSSLDRIRPNRGAPRVRRETLSIALELTLGVYLLICLIWAFTSNPAIWTTPFLMLFATGYLFVGVSSIRWPHWSMKLSPIPEKPVA